MYTPGVAANHDIQNGGGGVIRTYQPIDTGFAYMNAWTGNLGRQHRLHGQLPRPA